MISSVGLNLTTCANETLEDSNLVFLVVNLEPISAALFDTCRGIAAANLLDLSSLVPAQFVR
jgi:hypothetical protein